MFFRYLPNAAQLMRHNSLLVQDSEIFSANRRWYWISSLRRYLSFRYHQRTPHNALVEWLRGQNVLRVKKDYSAIYMSMHLY